MQRMSSDQKINIMREKLLKEYFDVFNVKQLQYTDSELQSIIYA